jgi:CDP-6-deoxy-D-xylo-4-hexulose-3-dehydrase
MTRDKILSLVKEYYNSELKNRKFSPDRDIVRYAGRVFDENELVKLVEASLDFWLTEGRFSEEFSEKIAEFLGVENVILTNSGSSANLLAFSALTSEKLGKRRLLPGDEVISVAAGFPATVTPIVQNNMIPVFVDVDIPTYNIDIEMLKKSISDRTKCIFIAHTLGNPFNAAEVTKIAEQNNLWLIEDNCDAFGSRYGGAYTGTFGHISTMSFYPAHHITTGEGGAVVTNDEELAKIIRSFRDWGRDCYCASGENNTCGKRFTQQFGTLPAGYDHKYVYSELGYNLKMTDMQAAIGSAQMDKLENFCNKRKENFERYQRIFAPYKKHLVLPEATPNSDPAWFSYILTVKKDAPFTRNDFVKHLNDNRIETRNIFAGNIIRQPAFINIKHRVAVSLDNTDFIMNNTFFLGTYPGLTDEMFDYISKVVIEFMNGK